MHDGTLGSRLGSIADSKKSESIAFGELHARYARRLRAYLLTILGEERDVDDVLQDVLLSIYRALPDIDETRGTAEAYVFAIARNAALSHKKRASATPIDPHQLSALRDRRWVSDDFFSLVDDLPIAYRQALTLRFVFGFDSEEAGRVMKRSAQAVRQLQARGRQLMRARLERSSHESHQRLPLPAVRRVQGSRVLTARRVALSWSV